MVRHVSIVVPTQRRPAGLETALRSILGQSSVDFSTCELVVVDNDAVRSAEPLVRRLGAGAAFEVIYVHEPRPGVATARNRALSAVSGEFIAFLDDDEEASTGWLHALLAVQAQYDADVVFGPVKGRTPPDVIRHRAYFERFFSRIGPQRSCLLNHYYGCGDSLIRRAALPSQAEPFSVRNNHSGGEDDLLFAAMRANGARFAWAPEAWVWEDPGPSRLTLRYTFSRAFGYGQGPAATCAAARPRDWLGLAGWMSQGVVQALIFGVIAAVQFLIGEAEFTLSAERAVRGLGKTFWWEPFKIAYYGLPPGASPLALSALKKLSSGAKRESKRPPCTSAPQGEL
jgi:cellulose synthase/poly-beta-1,6-N-acetylglucosamine synthase-like glycosyltransferase